MVHFEEEVVIILAAIRPIYFQGFLVVERRDKWKEPI